MVLSRGHTFLCVFDMSPSVLLKDAHMVSANNCLYLVLILIYLLDDGSGKNIGFVSVGIRGRM